MKTLIATALSFAFLLQGCAVVPPETVKLSSGVGQQMAEIKKSHIAEINAYFGAIEQQTSRAVDELYAPEIIKKSLNGAAGKKLFAKLEDGKKGGQAAEDALEYMTHYVMTIRNLVESERATRLRPIIEARNRVLANAEVAWSQAIQGNATITGYLASAVKIRETQDNLFAKLGAPVTTQELGGDLADLSDKVQKAVDTLRAKDDQLDQTKAALDKALAAIKDKTKP